MTNCAVVIRALVEKLETRVKIMVLNFAANRGIAAEPNQTNRGLSLVQELGRADSDWRRKVSNEL